MSGDFAVIVAFTVRPEDRAAFMVLLRENARMSLELEPGCRRFDIVETTLERGDVWLYEIYATREEFEAHLKAPHFLRFDAAVRDMVTGKTVITGRLEERVSA